MINKRAYYFARFLGMLFMGFCFYFLFKSFCQLNFNTLHFPKPLHLSATIFFLTLAYTILIGFDAFAWKLILEAIQNNKIRFWEAFSVYAKSGIAKYLPGNIFQFLSRNYIGSKIGWNHSDIALSSFIETFISMSFIITLLAFLYVMKLIPPLYFAHFYVDTDKILIGLFVFAIGTILSVLYYNHKKIVFKLNGSMFKKSMLLVSKIYLIKLMFGLIVGNVIFLLVLSLGFECDVLNKNLPNVLAAVALASSAGFIAPGAPGGLGVRESLLVLLLSGYYGRETILLAALIFRVITILSDFLAFLSVVLIKSNHKPTL